MGKNQPAPQGKKPTPEQIEQLVDSLGTDTGQAIANAHGDATPRNPQADEGAAERLSGW